MNCLLCDSPNVETKPTGFAAGIIWSTCQACGLSVGVHTWTGNVEYWLKPGGIGWPKREVPEGCLLVLREWPA